MKPEQEEREDTVEQRVSEVVSGWVKGTGAALGCVDYWNKAATAEDKSKIMEDWVGSTGGMTRVIAATKALRLGVDVADVRLVMDAGMPRDLRNFVQESGRGGRDGQKSESVVARIGCEAREEQCDVCEREELAEEAEGAEEEEKREGEAREIEADFERRQRGVKRADKERRLAAIKEAGDEQEFEKVADEWVGCWVVCKVEDREDMWHGLESWPGKGSEMWELVAGRCWR